MERVFVVEANKKGSEHVSFNAAVLKVLQDDALQRGSKVQLFCDRTHLENLKSVLRDVSGFNWQEIAVVSGFSRKFLRKFICEFVVVFRILIRARREKATVVMLSAFPNALACILLFRWMFRDVPLHVFLHAELESLILPDKQSIRREGFWTKLAILKLYKGLWPAFYVLGSGIRERLIHRFPLQHLKAIRVIDHPYVFSETEGKTTAQEDGKLRIGFVGTGRVVKGIEEFYRLADALSEHIVAGELEFVVIGGLEGVGGALNSKRVRVMSNQPAGLSVGEFRQAIRSLDCALILYRENYVLTASGALFDIINEGVEVLSLNNYFLNDVAEGDVEGGIKFFKDASEIEVEIRKRLKARRSKHEFDYGVIKRRHSVDVRRVISREIFGSDEPTTS